MGPWILLALALAAPGARAAGNADRIDALAAFLPLERDAVWEFDCVMKRDGSADFRQGLKARVASVAREEDALTAELEWSGPAFDSVKRLLPRQVFLKPRGIFLGDALWVKFPPEKRAAWDCGESPWQCGQEPRDGPLTVFKTMSQKIQGETDISKKYEWVLEPGKGLTSLASAEETMMGTEWAKASASCRRKAKAKGGVK